MKKTLLILTLICSNLLFSQVGFGTTIPTATLDVLSTSANANTKALEIKNENNTEIFTIFNNGNLQFEGAFIPNGDAGTAGQYLVSGGNNSPFWKTLDLPLNSEQVLDVLNISTISNSTNVAANTWRKIVFSNSNLAADSTIGIWNSATNEFTVVKPGLYFISAGVEMFTNTLDANNSGALRIVSGSQIHEYPSLTSQCSLCNPVFNWDNCNGERVVKLIAGDKIWIESRTIHSWQQAQSFLQIKYSEL